jgi:hypothetical protein
MYVRLKKVSLFTAAAVAQRCARHNRYDAIRHNVCSEARLIRAQKCSDCELFRATNIAQKLSLITNYGTLLCECLIEL